jgi:putative N6-adenine-specific DNA methylase
LKKLQSQEEQDPQFIEFLQQFGQHLKNAFGGWNVFVLTADMALPGQLRIKESKRTPIFNGPLECRLFKFEMHQKRDPVLATE